jgi:hypothetical protein
MTREYEIIYEWNASLIEKALSILWKKQRNVIRFLIVWGMLALIFLYTSLEKSRFVFGEAVFAVGMLFAVALSLITQHYKTKKLVNALPSAKVTVRMNEEYFESSADDTHGRFYWRAFREVQMTPEVTLLFPKRGIGTYIPVPTQAMSEEIQAFLIEKIEENGGKVVR